MSWEVPPGAEKLTGAHLPGIRRKNNHKTAFDIAYGEAARTGRKAYVYGVRVMGRWVYVADFCRKPERVGWSVPPIAGYNVAPFNPDDWQAKLDALKEYRFDDPRRWAR